MIVRTFKMMWSLIVLAIVLFVVFYVPVGERTLFQHFVRIAQTEEAQELGRDVSEAGAEFGQKIRDEVQRARETAEDPP